MKDLQGASRPRFCGARNTRSAPYYLSGRTCEEYPRVVRYSFHKTPAVMAASVTPIVVKISNMRIRIRRP